MNTALHLRVRLERRNSSESGQVLHHRRELAMEIVSKRVRSQLNALDNYSSNLTASTAKTWNRDVAPLHRIWTPSSLVSSYHEGGLLDEDRVAFVR